MDAAKHAKKMKIREIVYTQDPKLIHPDINRIINRYEKRATKRVKQSTKMGYNGVFPMGYPFRVK
jgi:hypothetical protein